jgi:hypothetical protein
MSELFNMAGMDLPGYLGKEREKEEEAIQMSSEKQEDTTAAG